MNLAKRLLVALTLVLPAGFALAAHNEPVVAPQLPAFVGGDCTTTAGSVVVSCATERGRANTWTGPQTESVTSSGLSIGHIIANRQGGSGSAAVGFDVTAPSETATAKAGMAFTRNAGQGAGVLSLCNRGSTDAVAFTTADCFLTHNSNGGGVGTTTLGKPGDNTTLQGTVFMGPASALAVGSNNAVAAPQMFSFVQNNTSANYTYNGPMVFFERHDNTSSSTTTSNWGNSQLSPLILANIVVGPNSRNNPNAIAIQIENDNPAVPSSSAAGATSINATTGVSILMQCNPGAGNLCEDSFGMNLVASYLSGNPPQNLMFLEADMLNATNPVGIPGNGGACFCGIFLQSGGQDSSGNKTYGSAGVYVSAVATGNGWLYGYYGSAYFYNYGIKINNAYNNPNGGGISVYTTYGGVGLPVADFGVGTTSMFSVSGNGAVTVGYTNGAVTTFKAGLVFSAYATAPPTGTTKGSVCLDSSNNVYVKTSTGACL